MFSRRMTYMPSISKQNMTDFKSTYTDFETIKHMLFYVSTEMLSEEKLQIN